jgi:hypothetical protein
MPFTGDLEHLNLVDIIQLVHTTRKSGVFSVKGSNGESRIVFSNGFIVSANHVDNSVRIGTVLVRSGAVTIDDLKQALDVTKNAGRNRRPLMATLIEMGKLKREDAVRGLRKLVEMTIVELMGWRRGTFTFNTDPAAISSEGAASYCDTEQDVGVDAQMVLMDALRIFDERARDRAAGKEVLPLEAVYADVLPGESAAQTEEELSTITAEDLGLADIDRLEKKIPRPASEMEIFDPVEIHRRNIREMLDGFSSGEQEAFVSFVGKSVARKSAPGAAAQQAGKAVVIFGGDRLIRHSVMTICKEDGVPVFAADDERDLERIVSQCLAAMRMPLAVFDSPVRSEEAFTEKKILSTRTAVMRKHPTVPVIQFASVDDPDFFLQSYSDGVRAVFPKPLKEVRKETYVHDTIQFLDTFKSFIKSYQERIDTRDRHVKELKDNIKMLREITTPSDAAMVMLAFVADWFERAITFFVRPSELIGERSVGVGTEKSVGPTRADRLKISLAKPSIFRDVLEKGRAFYGGSGDEVLSGLFLQIGTPLSPAVVLLPMICDRKVVAVVYGDFGKKEASPVQLDILEILAQQVGIALEYVLFRRHVQKAAQQA